MGNSFPERLKEARQKKGLSQRTLADKIGLIKNQIWHYENGKTEPRLSTLVWIADALEVSIDWLVGRANDD